MQSEKTVSTTLRNITDVRSLDIVYLSTFVFDSSRIACDCIGNSGFFVFSHEIQREPLSSPLRRQRPRIIFRGREYRAPTRTESHKAGIQRWKIRFSSLYPMTVTRIPIRLAPKSDEAFRNRISRGSLLSSTSIADNPKHSSL